MGNRSKCKQFNNVFKDKKTGKTKSITQRQGGASGTKWVVPVEYRDAEGIKRTTLVGVDKKARKAMRWEALRKGYLQS